MSQPLGNLTDLVDLEASDVVVSLTDCAMTHEINQELAELGGVSMMMMIILMMMKNGKRCCMLASRTWPATDLRRWRS